MSPATALRPRQDQLWCRPCIRPASNTRARENTPRQLLATHAWILALVGATLSYPIVLSKIGPNFCLRPPQGQGDAYQGIATPIAFWPARLPLREKASANTPLADHRWTAS